MMRMAHFRVNSLVRQLYCCLYRDMKKEERGTGHVNSEKAVAALSVESAPLLLRTAIQLELILHNLLQGFIRKLVISDFSYRNLAAIHEEHRRFIHVEVFAELDGSVDRFFGG